MLRLCVPVQAFFYPHAEHSGQEVVANLSHDERTATNLSPNHAPKRRLLAVTFPQVPDRSGTFFFSTALLTWRCNLTRVAWLLMQHGMFLSTCQRDG
jgi:hypothetical protein